MSLPITNGWEEELRFCSYAARLPEMSRMLCKKLGGPLSHSPARPAPRKAPSSLKPPKPGAAVKRSQPRQARRTLERVLTDEKTCRRPAPSLSRSVTDSVLPNLKREASDVSLSNVPLSRTTFHKSNRYSQREVDLTAVSQAAEVKAKKKANIEQELQGAIAALKKPNPRMAVKEFVEAAEQRAAGVKSRSRNQVPNIVTSLLIACRTQYSCPKSLCAGCPDHGYAKRQPAERRVQWTSVTVTVTICHTRRARGDTSVQLYSRSCVYGEAADRHGSGKCRKKR